MDLVSAFGLLLGGMAIVLGQYLEGGHLASLVQPTAALIVFGGTAGATLLSVPGHDLGRGLRMIGLVFRKRPDRKRALIKSFVQFAEIARKDGIIALEARVDKHPDALFRRAMQCIVDGVSTQALQEILTTDVETRSEKNRAAAQIFEVAGGYAPTMGILGAVLGLVQVMENLNDPSALGSGIAVAFVATIYGVGLANIVLLPFASKLRRLTEEEEVCEEMVIQGALAIEDGQNPRAVRDRLDSYLAS
jgi:chemotaxis protein MotA